MEIPNADKHRHIDKSGYLQKLCGRTFPYLNQWRRRFCVLSRGKLYFYEKEDSKGSDKSSGLIDLKYFNQIIEAPPKDAKKATNVFLITSQDRSFFDPGRYLLSADTLTEMNDWILRLRESLEFIKNNNRPLRKEEREKTASNEPSKGNAKKKDPAAPDEDTHDGVKKSQQNFDQRKADIESRLASSLTSSGQEISSSKALQKNEGKRVKLNNETRSHHQKTEEGQLHCTSAMGESKPLESITKYRPKGPVGRRAPHSRRTALMKQRASSLSALQQSGNPPDDALRSGASPKDRLSTLTTDGLGFSERTSFGYNNSGEGLSEFGFEDIDSDLFFKRPELILEESNSLINSSKNSKLKKTKKTKISSKITQTLTKSRNSNGESERENAIAVNRRDTFISRFRTMRSPIQTHPDDNNKRVKRCTIF